MSGIRKPEIRTRPKLDPSGAPLLDQNKTPLAVDDLRDVVKSILCGYGYPSVTALADAIGIPQQTVNDWFKKDSKTSPRLETLTEILDSLNTNPVHFFARYKPYAHPGYPEAQVYCDRIAGILGEPELARKMMLLLEEWRARGLLTSSIEHLIAQHDLDPQMPIRSLRRLQGEPRKKKP